MKTRYSLLLAASVGATFLTGCAMNRDTTQHAALMPNSTIAFTPVTTPDDLTRWASIHPNMRAIETYTIVVPSEPQAGVTVQEGSLSSAETMEPGTYFHEAAGGAGGETYKVIRYTPNQH
jgi:hypothetical protein